MSQIKERPILFSGAMVRALLDGSKTQTRRAIKPQPANGISNINGNFVLHSRTVAIEGGSMVLADPGAKNIYGHVRCPYGRPGERLWVRECFASGKKMGEDGYLTDEPLTIYRATDEDVQWYDGADDCPVKTPWKPSIHMPRVASRLLLEVVSVRVERLQAISEADAVAEGIEPYDLPGVYKLYGSECSRPIGSVAATRTDYVQPVKSYESLWELINGAGSWALNPWVWVVEFKVIEPAPMQPETFSAEARQWEEGGQYGG